MIGYLLRILIFVALLIPAVVNRALAQDSLTLGAWATMALSAKLSPAVRLSMESAARTGFQARDQTYFGQLGVKWRFSKHWYFTPRLRIGHALGPIVFHRWFFALGHSAKPLRFTVSSRLAYQYRVAHYTDFGVDMHRDHWRWRSGLGYNFRGWKADPELELELFVKANKRQPVEMDLLRLKLGTELTFCHRWECKIFTLADIDPNFGFVLDRIVLGFELEYKLPYRVKTAT